ncbi:KQDN repeat-containing protein [Legionella beliardensis]|uniref:KQDN repeat-containing protein n=1 Tax=Legionella beliardensis TaxID=91822 RepID=A0A378I677_9GAMM|nr:BatD family protein [Legionella beliardensis]STX30161.1 KQDN repeat-containing protein [Legionella beliardensis]
MKKLIFAAIIVLYSSIIQAELSVQVDATNVQKGETFHLIITNDSATTGIPDLTPLQTNFTIVGTQRSTNYSVINGKATSSNQWIIALLPKKTGNLTIPAIQVGQEHTPAKTIEVTKSQTNATSTDAVKQQDVILKAELSNNTPYVNEQVIYTVKLYNSRRLLDVNYQGPQVDDALLIPLGDGRRYQAAENGRIYAVEEQQYAIFPQKSGEIKITPPSFNALIYDSMPEPVHIQAAASQLKVKSVPLNFQGKNWLPAKQVNLAEKYDQTLTSIEQGNTLRRTVTLQAIGTPAQLLPNLTFTSNDKFSVYPEKPIEKNSFRQFELIGTTTFNITYILNKPGKVTIPAIQIPWFNIVTNKEEVATLPALTLNVIASTNNTSTNANITANKKVDQNNDTSQEVASITKNSNHASDIKPPLVTLKSKVTNNIAWWLASGFALAWLITLLLWWKQGSQLPFVKATRRKKIIAQLKQACLTNQPELARIALLNWAHLQWPNRVFLTLADVNRLVNDRALKHEINELSKVLYHINQHTWQGERLWKIISNYKANDPTSKSKVRPLKPLNPL